MTVLMGANIANEVADEKFCETTIGMEFISLINNIIKRNMGTDWDYLCVISGCKDKEHGLLLKELMHTTNFRVTVVEESDVVEICGALKVFHPHQAKCLNISIYLSR